MFGFNVQNFIAGIKKHGVAQRNRYEIQFGAYGDSPRFVFNKENTELLNQRLETVSFPASTIGSKGHVLQGIEREMPYGRIYEGDVALSFLETYEYNIRKLFTEWQEKIIDSTNYTHGYYNDYVTSLDISSFPITKQTKEISLDIPNLNREGPIRPTPLAAAAGLTENVINFLRKKDPAESTSLIPPGALDIKLPDQVNIPINPLPSYQVRLIQVFPKTINEIQLSAGSEELVKTEIVLSFRKWEIGVSEPNIT